MNRLNSRQRSQVIQRSSGYNANQIMKEANKNNIDIFLEEIQKRTAIPEGEFEDFLKLWEFRKFCKNEVILRSDEVPEFSMFVLKGCLRQFILNDRGEESIVYFGEERHFIG